jgi:hypothetical protein
MTEKPDFKPYLIRLAIVFVVSLVFVTIFNEGAHLLQREQYDRAPEVIQLVIPAGTAERVAAGEPVPSIPEDLIFVVGDTLEVVNQDREVHQLGPLTVPPGASARMAMEKPDKYAYACSFQPSQYLGLDVRQGTTLMTRLTALLIAVPTTTAFLYIYSLPVFPIRSRAKAAPEQPASRQG